MKPFRCLNDACMIGAERFDFYAIEPICPKCGLDGRTNGRGVVMTLVETHFVPLKMQVNGRGISYGMGGGQGAGYLACDPTRKLRGLSASDNPTVVNCWACQQTDLWKEANRKTVPLDATAAIKAAGGVVVELQEAGCCG